MRTLRLSRKASEVCRGLSNRAAAKRAIGHISTESAPLASGTSMTELEKTHITATPAPLPSLQISLALISHISLNATFQA